MRKCCSPAQIGKISNAKSYIVLSGANSQVSVNLFHSLGNFSRRQIDDVFLFVFQKTRFNIPCKWSPMEAICMKCQILLSGKNKKNVSICRLLKDLSRVLSVKHCD